MIIIVIVKVKIKFVKICTASREGDEMIKYALQYGDSL